MNDPGERQRPLLGEEGSGDIGNDESAAPPSPLPLPAPATGRLVTNHLNLMYMLAAGLVMPPSGFGDKYYRDTLADFPGWIPVFIDGRPRKAPHPPRRAIDLAAKEAGHLRPVIVEIDLEGLQGPVQVLGEGGWGGRRLDEGVAPGDRLLLLPAPLPVSRIRTIVFRSVHDKKETVADAEERSNVPVRGFSLKAQKSWFSSRSPRLEWPPADGPEDRPAASIAAAFAAGGVLAALQDHANSGDLAVQACRAAFDPGSEPPDDPMFRHLPEWLRGERLEAEGPPRSSGQMFQGAVDRLVERRNDPAGGKPGNAKTTRSGCATRSHTGPRDVLVDFLTQAAGQLEDARRKGALALANTLESLGGGLGGGSISEMLAEHETPLARAMVLFFLRERTADLDDIFRAYGQLGDRDKLAAAVLFGARDGWLRLPTDLRGSPEIRCAVTHRMAALVHRIDETGFDLGPMPDRVVPLRERFSTPEPWGKREERAALLLARESKWDCIRSHVTLRSGDYRMRIARGAVRIEFKGEAPVSSSVAAADLLDHLARERIRPKLEAKVRELLGG